MERNIKFLFIIPLPALLTPLPIITFTNKEITVCTNEVAKDANKAPRNSSSCLFYFMFYCFTVTPSTNTPKFSQSFMILIISFICSFQTNKVNPFSTLTTPSRLVFLSNLFIALEVKLLTDPSKLFIAKEIATFVSTFYLY